MYLLNEAIKVQKQNVQKIFYKTEWKGSCFGKLLLVPQKVKHMYHVTLGIVPRKVKICVYTKTFMCVNVYSRYYS